MKPGTRNAALLGVLMLIGALWFFSSTEWVEVLRTLPPKGEAARDGRWAVKQVLQRLGVKVVTPENLDRLPPPGATLVLDSPQWNFLPERNARLRAWVEAGGHLVLPSFYSVGDDIAWVQIRSRRNAPAAKPASAPKAAQEADEDDDEADADDAQAPEPPASAPPAQRRERFLRHDLHGPRYTPDNVCPRLHEAGEGAAAPPREFRLCNVWGNRLEPMRGVRALWTLEDSRGAAVLRIPVGRGRVTTLTAFGMLNNHGFFYGDHAQAAVALLDVAPGRELWFVVEERRATLIAWLWAHAGPALLLALAAGAFALWRGAVRFGPLLPRPALARRSIAEQVRGSAAFVRWQGGKPLWLAQRRALDDAARRRLPGYDHLVLGERAQRVAQATALEADALRRALDPNLSPSRRDLPDLLALLETARRRLELNPIERK